MDTIPPSATQNTDVFSSIHGCWIGKSIGGTLGLPAEGKMERLNFTFYNPIPDIAPPNDDLELQLVWLHLVENSGAILTQSDFAKAWIDHIHYMWDEYGRARWNLRRGVPVESVGTFENFFHAGMGSPIRSEIWACLFPGDSDSAAHYAALDASLDHGVEGIAGEVFLAVMQSAVFGGAEIEKAIASALKYIPVNCESSRAIAFVQNCHREGEEAWNCWKKLLSTHGNENFTHAPLNIALTVWALLYGGGDFEKSILLAVNGGYDTDCTAATVGATIGFSLGAENIPSRWSEPIGDKIFVGDGIIGISAPKTLGELTERTVALIGKLERKSWSADYWKTKIPAVELSSLSGTIQVTPRDAGEPVPWANGELPPEIKRTGGGSWVWELTDDEPKVLICLAREGAKLFINDFVAIDCPAGLPYVPATHRCALGSRALISLSPGSFKVTLELGSDSPDQEVSVILANLNLHICSWNEELPNPARLARAPVISLM